MPLQKALTDHDPLVTISDPSAVEQLGDTVLLGNWFVFLRAEWLRRSGMNQLFPAAGIGEQLARPTVLFRGKDTLTLPGARIAPRPLPRPNFISLTCDKALYRAGRDTVRLIIAAPQQPSAQLTLSLHLSGSPYADYPLTLDEYGLCLWSMRDLPEGEYVAKVPGAEDCRFEVAEYRLAPLNAELVEQQLNAGTLRYVLSVTSFNQPYSGPVEIELQERGQRVGERTRLHCNRDGQCRGAVKLSGAGPYTLNVIAGERTATVTLKGSEQQRRETLTISELGEVREISLLPLPQSNQCRGVYVTRGGANTEPFLVQRVVGREVEITPRTSAEVLRVVVVDPTRSTSQEQFYEPVAAGQAIRMPIPQPYGVVLLGAFVNGEAWEGWCAILRPSDLQLQCETPKEVRPGSSITVTLKTGVADRVVPVQLIVKDARLVTTSDSQVELAARIKQNLKQWREQTGTGIVERQLSHMNQIYMPRMMRTANGGRMGPMVTGFAAPTSMPMPPPIAPMAAPGSSPQNVSSMRLPAPGMALASMASAAMTSGQQLKEAVSAVQAPAQGAPTTSLTKIRLQFPEILYNNIIKVKGQASVEVTLGDSLTRYTVEAFALSPETLDWQRVETTVEAVQPVYGELTLSPFVFPGDPVMGRLDVGAASGGAIVEVHHDGEVIALFLEDGSPVTPGLPIPSGSVVRFPVRPGAITTMVRDARKGGVDVSERYVTPPGTLRHMLRYIRLLTAGDEVTLQGLHARELKPMPGLERPFQFFVEAASRYPYGCVEQTSSRLLAMYAGYVTNRDNLEVAQEYQGAILMWYKRLASMYLPKSGFCLYPPQEGGARKPDTHYAPLAVRHLLSLPTAAQAGITEKPILQALESIHTMASDAANYYKIDNPPREINDCRAAYQVLTSDGTSQRDKEKAIAFARSRLTEQQGQTYVVLPESHPTHRLCGGAVSTRVETAYAAAALLATKESSDLPRAIAATNYLTSQFNAEGRLYSTVDTAACLALLLGLRESGVISSAETSRVMLNGQECSLAQALMHEGTVESVYCLEGVIAVQVTAEVTEDWSTWKGQLPVEVRLERKGHVQHRFNVGDELELVIRVPQYEPGLIAHVCLPDALARIVGGGQVKRFSLDFCEKNVLRVPLAAINSTHLPNSKDAGSHRDLLHWLGFREKAAHVQHWAVIVRNMFKEERVGNPGLLEVEVV
jgi:hypothetical protein